MMFLKEFLANPLRVGAVWPSSEELTELITSSTSIKDARCIVELGPGTGVFTKKILEKKNDKAVFLAIENNRKFARQVRDCFSGVTVCEGCASGIKVHLGRSGMKKCNLIISGLPWASFERKKQIKIIRAIKDSLAKGGEFRTFAYLHARLLPSAVSFRKILEENFSTVRKTRTAWKNLPPAFVYVCTK